MNVNEVNMQGSDSGTTTGTEAIAATLFNGKGAVVKIKNTHATSTMYYRIDVYSSKDAACVADPVKAWTSIAANTLLKDTTSLVEPYARAIIYVKQNSAAGGYTIDVAQY